MAVAHSGNLSLGGVMDTMQRQGATVLSIVERRFGAGNRGKLDPEEQSKLFAS